MVDFNNESVMNTTHEYLLQLLILEDWNNVKISIQEYYKKLSNNQGVRIAEFKGRLIGLFILVKFGFRKYLKDSEKFNEFNKNLFESDKFDELMKLFGMIEEYLYSSGLTMSDKNLEILRGTK